MMVYITPKRGGKTVCNKADRVRTFSSAFGAHFIELELDKERKMTISVADYDVEIEG